MSRKTTERENKNRNKMSWRNLKRVVVFVKVKLNAWKLILVKTIRSSFQHIQLSCLKQSSIPSTVDTVQSS